MDDKILQLQIGSKFDSRYYLEEPSNVKNVQKIVDFVHNINKLFENNKKDLAQYIVNEIIEYDGFKMALIDNFLYISYQKLAAELYINIDNNAVFVAPEKAKRNFSPLKVIENLCNTIDIAQKLQVLYEEYSNEHFYVSRDDIIEFIKEFPYIPITHFFFNNDEFIFSYNEDTIKDQNGNIFEDDLYETKSRYYPGMLINRGLRKRKEGNWVDGWNIKVFENWYSKTKSL